MTQGAEQSISGRQEMPSQEEILTMRVSVLLEQNNSSIYQQSLAIARKILGEDFSLVQYNDFQGTLRELIDQISGEAAPFRVEDNTAITRMTLDELLSASSDVVDRAMQLIRQQLGENTKLRSLLEEFSSDTTLGEILQQTSLTHTPPIVDKEGLTKIMPIISQWFEAFNRHDIDMLLELYAHDARHFSPKLQERQPETEGWIQGTDQLRAWWEGAFERLPTLRYDLRNAIVREDGIIEMIYTRHVEGEPDMDVIEELEVQEREGKLLIVISRITDQVEVQGKICIVTPRIPNEKNSE
jgi:ketosteroid isomerase-like protein/arsenate reductase-like glutaredoxin family protein